jgi:flavin reductase (DIM6/NTAB) family NADH-FMN oxidoreductase RutF
MQAAIRSVPSPADPSATATGQPGHGSPATGSEAGVEAPQAVDPATLRAALGMFATGVTIVTTRTPEGQPVGLTVNSFNSVSLHPPLVLWSLGLRSTALQIFREAPRWAVHVLTAGQKALAERFAQRGTDRFAGIETEDGLGGLPLLPGAAAIFECQAGSLHEEGDHVILIGRVERCRVQSGGMPLIFHGGRFYTELPL